MPALPVVPNAIRVTLVYNSGADADIINRLFFGFTLANPSPAALTTFCTGVANAWNAEMAPRHSTDLTLTRVDAEDLTSASSAVASVSVSHSGTDGSAQLSAGAAFLISNKVSRRYRGGHSRTYLGGFTTSNLANPQTWDAAHAGPTLTAWENFITAVNADVWVGGGVLDQINVSYYHGFTNFTYPSGRTRAIPTVRPVPVTDAIIGYSYNPRVASQRRRNVTRV